MHIRACYDWKKCKRQVNLQSWTKVLGQIYICGAFSQAPNKFIYTFSAPPPNYNVGHVYMLFLQNFNIVLGERGEAAHFKTENSAFLKLRLKTPKINAITHSSVARNFLHHCNLYREAIPARSYMNGLISFARTKEETTETMPQTSNNNTCYMMTRNMIYILTIMRDAILLDSFLNSTPNLPNGSAALVFNIFHIIRW